MLPFVNPNYFNQPQYQSMYQMPQTAPTPTPNMSQFNLMGKVVENVDVVKTIDIPMDGQTYYFPKADGQTIYSKQWLNNGTTKITSYLPQIEPLEPKMDNLPPNELESHFRALNEAIERIESSVDALTEQINKSSRSKTRKEVTDES